MCIISSSLWTTLWIQLKFSLLNEYTAFFKSINIQLKIMKQKRVIMFRWQWSVRVTSKTLQRATTLPLSFRAAVTVYVMVNAKKHVRFFVSDLNIENNWHKNVMKINIESTYTCKRGFRISLNELIRFRVCYLKFAFMWTRVYSFSIEFQVSTLSGF